MRKPVYILIFCLSVIMMLCFSCEKEKQIKKQETVAENPKKDSIASPKKIGFYMGKDNSNALWTAEQTAEGSFYPKIIFYEEYARMQFHGQCYYWFFTNHYYTGTDKIELVWTYKKDFVYDIESLGKTNGVKNYPKYGDAFCEYKLVNDTVIKVKYNFPEWVKKVNAIEKDSIFPQYFYLEQIDDI